MAAGFQVTKADIDQQAGAIARSVFNVLGSVQQFKAWLDGLSVPDLVTLGYTTGDANELKSAFTEMANVATVWNNGASGFTLPHDHTIFPRRLIGTGLY